MPSRPRFVAAVLQVEDQKGDIHLLEEAFHEVCRSTVVSSAASSPEAWTLLRKWQVEGHRLPDLIFLDLGLPGPRGEELLTQLKADPRLRLIPVLILTISESAHDIAWCYSHGANAYFVKPVTYEAFARVIRRICNHWLDHAAGWQPAF